MAAILRGMPDEELLALAGSEVCDLSRLSDDQLNAVIDGTAGPEVKATLGKR